MERTRKVVLRLALAKRFNMLIEAVRAGDEAKVLELLQSGINPKDRDSTFEGNTILHHAVYGPSLAVLELLLNLDCDVSKANYVEVSPVEVALKLNKYDFAEMLMIYGARINIKLFRQFCAPVNTIRRKWTLLLFRYLDLSDWNGTDISTVLPECLQEDIDRPLQLAVEALNIKCVSLLIKMGVDLETRDEYGQTPLHYAAAPRQPDDLEEGLLVMGLLLHAGCDANKRSNTNVTPLHIAAITGTFGYIQLLLKYGADPNVRDDTGYTPLYRLVHETTEEDEHHRLKAKRLMIRAGGDLRLVPKGGLPPPHLSRFAQ